MTDLHKEIFETSFPDECTLDDIRRLKIKEAAEDEDCYYIRTARATEERYGPMRVWLIDKKTGCIRNTDYLTWIGYVEDALKENRVKRIDPPFDSIKV